MKQVRLIKPEAKYAVSCAEAVREGLHLEPSPEEDIQLLEQDFDAYMHKLHDLSRPVILPNGQRIARVPQHDYWLVRGDRFIGVTSIRPQLNESLMQRGGNIGYAVRASERRKGYGKTMLQLALPHLRAFGLKKALITCHDKNEASIRIIEGAGGVMENAVKIEGLDTLQRRYWLIL